MIVIIMIVMLVIVMIVIIITVMIILKYLMAKMINHHKLKNSLETWEVLVFQALEICYL